MYRMVLLIYYNDTLNNKNRRDPFHVVPEIPKPVIEKPSYKTLKWSYFFMILHDF